MSDEEKASTPPDTQVPDGTGSEGARSDAEASAPELNIGGPRPRAGEFSSLPRRKEPETPGNADPASGGNDGHTETETGDDPHHDGYHHDDYHDPAHYEDDHHHDHPSDPEDDWWEEDEQDEDEQLTPEGEMSFLDHLEELRWTIFKSLGALILGCIIVGINLKLFADLLQAPIEYVSMGGGGLVYTVSDDHKLHALQRDSGKSAWEADALFQPLVDEEGVLYVVAAESQLVALDGRTGKQKWELTTSGPVRAPPVMDGKGVLYVPTGDKKVLAVDSANGKQKWEHTTSGEVQNSPLLPPDNEDIELRTRQPLGVLMVLMQVVFFGGVAVSMPFILLFASGFIAPGLTRREKRMLLPGSIAGLVLFLAGAALAFFFIIPVSLRFSAVLNDWMGIELLWDVNDYYSLVVMVTLSVGALFQFPLLLVIMGYLGILPSAKLKQGRKMVFVIIMIVAALLTPGDVIVALVLLTVPLYMLFEGSILMVGYVERGKVRRKAKIEARREQRAEARKAAKEKAEEALADSKKGDPGEGGA